MLSDAEFSCPLELVLVQVGGWAAISTSTARSNKASCCCCLKSRDAGTAIVLGEPTFVINSHIRRAVKGYSIHSNESGVWERSMPTRRLSVNRWKISAKMLIFSHRLSTVKKSLKIRRSQLSYNALLCLSTLTVMQQKPCTRWRWSGIDLHWQYCSMLTTYQHMLIVLWVAVQ